MFCFLKGAAVVLTPAYCDTQITSPVTVNVEITFGNGRDAKSSDPIEFTYKPKPNFQVQEVEMHPSLTVETLLPMDIFSVGEIVMNGLPPEQVLEPPTQAPLPAPAAVVPPPVNDEQGKLMIMFSPLILVQLLKANRLIQKYHPFKLLHFRISILEC